MSTTDTVEGLESMVEWCVPGFVESARRARLPGTYRGERFWHGKPTVERHKFWTVSIPCLTTESGRAVARVHFDGRWDWVVRPSEGTVLPTGLDQVQAAFDAALRDGAGSR
ncbi:hypothetical protein [Rhodococcus sp. X156]|uniref:hypothetical protein n=1 Tax=Rhodococcus sp. X156 TaxID=2499145 RepID=UPI000FD7AF7A|nr:hypothetical protein [Rhodococcus sp. X156]